MARTSAMTSGWILKVIGGCHWNVGHGHGTDKEITLLGGHRGEVFVGFVGISLISKKSVMLALTGGRGWSNEMLGQLQ